jgi:hypothetical protein
MHKLLAGFYWARRKDGGELTVVEIIERNSFKWVQQFGTLRCAELTEAANYFEFISRIDEPQPRTPPAPSPL